ncbi:MAG: type IV pili twitching motility protein PilT, partial [Vibrio cyclitrophicus]
MELNQILDGMIEQKASDLYLTVDAPVLFRVDGELRPQGEKLDAQQVKQLLDAMMDSDRAHEYKKTREANFAIVRDSGRFRVSAFYQ